MDRIDFSPIEEHIRKARIERAVYGGEMIAAGIVWSLDGVRRVVQTLSIAGKNALQPPAFYTTSVTRRAPPA